jgi:hypothetical protein
MLADLSGHHLAGKMVAKLELQRVERLELLMDKNWENLKYLPIVQNSRKFPYIK